jgi:hypothetical protein|tara:strand:- start:38 stop:235 length:198 start_codon:yes stop_codon:yes gene_type:complete
MEAIIIKADNKIVKLLIQLAEKLGAEVSKLSKSEVEDFTFGEMMDEAKTDNLVSKSEVLDYLKSK